MADNIDITPGVGKTVATDDCGAAGHAQVVKLAISTDGSATPIPADATYGIDVDVTRTSIEATDNGAFTDGTTKVVPAGLIFDEVAGTALTENDVGAARMDAKRAAIGVIEDATTRGQRAAVNASGQIATNAQGPVAHDAAASGNPLLNGAYASAAAPTNVSADGDVVRLWALQNGALAVQPTASGTLIAAGNGTAATAQRVTIASDSTGTIADSQAIADNAGFTDGTSRLFMSGFIFDEVAGTALTENDAAAARIDSKRAVVIALEDATTRGQRASIDSSGRLATIPAGGVAHDGVDSGNPVKVGGRAAAAAASVTLVAAADRSDLVTDLDGALITRPWCQLGDIISDVKTNTDGASTAFTGSFAATANVRNYVTSVTISNTSATAVTVDLRDGTAGSVIWTGIAPAGGGITHSFAVPLRQPTVNTALAFDGSAAASTVTVSVVGFKSKA